MEIVFFVVGLTLTALGGFVIFSEMKAGIAMRPITGRVVGFSTGRSKSTSGASLHTVAAYSGFDGRTYYIESSVGSSPPLHRLGDSIRVLVSPTHPENAVLECLRNKPRTRSFGRIQ